MLTNPFAATGVIELVVYVLLTGGIGAALGFAAAGDSGTANPRVGRAASAVGAGIGAGLPLGFAFQGHALGVFWVELLLYTLAWLVGGVAFGYQMARSRAVGTRLTAIVTAFVAVLVGWAIPVFEITIPVGRLFDAYNLVEVVLSLVIWGTFGGLLGAAAADPLGYERVRGAAIGGGLVTGLWAGLTMTGADMNNVLLEIVLFTLAWLVLGALPGFYGGMLSNYDPRRLAVLGAGVGLLVGYAMLANASTIERMGNAVLTLWGIALVIALIARYVPALRGSHTEIATQRTSNANMAYGLLLPPFVIVTAIIVFPMVWNLVLAFRQMRVGELRTAQLFALQGLGLENFNTIFRRSDAFFETFWPFLGYTLIFLAVLTAGWWLGRTLSRRLNYELDGMVGGWIGLTIALVLVILVGARQEYLVAIGDLLSGRRFIVTLLRSLVYTFLGTLLVLVFGLVAALIVKDSFPGRNIVRGFMLFPYIAPIVSVVLVWKILLSPQFGLINEGIHALGYPRVDFLNSNETAFIMIILFQAWRYFPFAFLFILARIQAVPDDIYEAARVDGASPSQRLFYITIPQLKAVFGTLFLLRFIWTFNKFDDVFLLTGGAADTQLVPIEIHFQLFGRSNVGTASAVAVVMAAVLFVIVGIYFRWFFVEEN